MVRFSVMPAQPHRAGAVPQDGAFRQAKENAMNDPKLPGEDEDERDQQAEQAREELDETPPPGTDPLHEGP
jgi:hypothetical protein